jgi:hypothetical protein
MSSTTRFRWVPNQATSRSLAALSCKDLSTNRRLHRPQRRWDRYRSLGPALLGSALWIDDLELIHKIGELASACIVVSKQGRKPREIAKLGPLAKVNEHTPGMPWSVLVRRSFTRSWHFSVTSLVARRR